MFVGTWDGGTSLYHSYMHFDFSPLNGKHILGATFYVYDHWSWSCQARGVGVYRVTQGWGGHSMTSWPGATYGEQIAWAAFAYGYTRGGCAAMWAGCDITGAVTNWTTGPWPQYGLMIREDTVSTSDNFAWKRFWTYNYGNGVTPQVAVSWKNRPTAATLTGPANNALLNTLTPTLGASASSPQGYPINYHYYVCNSLAAAQQVSATASTVNGCSRFDGGTSLTIPTNTLNVNTQYWWAVLVDDTIDYNLQAPTIWTFTAGIPPVTLTGSFTPPTPTAAGSQPMTITNYTSTTWGAGYVVSYHVYDAAASTQVLAQRHQTALPSPAGPGATVSITAVLDPVAGGSYTIYWDMPPTPKRWLSAPPFNIPMLWAKTPFSSLAPPGINSTSPPRGAAIPSLTPTLSVSATDPQGNALTYHFRLCAGSHSASRACVDSGTINPP